MIINWNLSYTTDTEFNLLVQIFWNKNYEIQKNINEFSNVIK